MTEDELKGLAIRLREALRETIDMRCSSCTLKYMGMCGDCVVTKSIRPVLKEAEPL